MSTAMASTLCKSALRVGSRILANGYKSFTAKSSSPFLISSPSSTNITRALRILSGTGSVESSMPLHSAIANARLISNIAHASTCWSTLSQGLVKTL
ncbi:PREDICTED: uncharacterized protein LOC109353658 isoform X1 [Lupinus angustifolius]|uniref:uncharacterized protein LOC109353658 isoform X1 n=1 Tax=Lupinus angustifolius TaxID=3871 RepID=UPI00092E575A|nr:PREDICTED: uncharacterized protein LOC109353658 isoform X1 [Lupinus angustifolius]